MFDEMPTLRYLYIIAISLFIPTLLSANIACSKEKQDKEKSFPERVTLNIISALLITNIIITFVLR